MDKEEILKKAQEENKGADLAELEAARKDSTYAILAAYIIATVLCVVQMAAGKGIDFGLYIVVTVIIATRSALKAKRNPSRLSVITAVMDALAAALFAVGFVISLFR